MSAAPGFEFPNPCPVCGADDDHAAWRAPAEDSPGRWSRATFCPHPAEPGHGTGCCCAGLPRPIFAFGTVADAGPFPYASSRLEERVTTLEEFARQVPARMDIPADVPMTEEQIAGFRRQFEEAMRQPDAHRLRVLAQPPPLTPEQVRYLLRECVTVVKPGETLVIRGRDWTPSQISEMQRYIDFMGEEGVISFKVLIAPGDELGVVQS